MTDRDWKKLRQILEDGPPGPFEVRSYGGGFHVFDHYGSKMEPTSSNVRLVELCMNGVAAAVEGVFAG